MQCKEASGQEYDKKICPAIRDLLGTVIAEFEEATLFIAIVYKVMMKIFTGSKEVRMAPAIFCTGADPNLIRGEAMSTMWLESIQQIWARIKQLATRQAESRALSV